MGAKLHLRADEWNDGIAGSYLCSANAASEHPIEDGFLWYHDVSYCSCFLTVAEYHSISLLSAIKTDSTDSTDITDINDITDGTDITDSTDITDGIDITDGTDITDSTDSTDGTDGIDGTYSTVAFTVLVQYCECVWVYTTGEVVQV